MASKMHLESSLDSSNNRIMQETDVQASEVQYDAQTQGITDNLHRNLNGRGDPYQHPISAITGLRDELDNLQAQLNNAGSSAYEIAVQNGYEGSEAQWLASLRGEAGSSGEDATVLRISSSRGNVFKNNMVSTVLMVTIYKGPKTITNRTELVNEYGSNARLVWRWQRYGESEFYSLVSTDSRIINDGFALTLSPEDVDTKVTFECQLITD